MNDVFAPYEVGLAHLLSKLGADHPKYHETLAFQSRLLENIGASRLWGDTTERRSERTQVLANLSGITTDFLDITFSDLCSSLATTSPGAEVTAGDEGYAYDVFLSYVPGSIFENWIHRLLLRKLEGYLKEYLVESIRIFKKPLYPSGFDDSVYARSALVRSRCLVAVCSPPYFLSAQCVYELAVMLERERRLGFRSAQTPEGLVLPICAFDGEMFPLILSQRVDWWCDCNGLTSESVIHSARGQDLDERIVDLASRVRRAILLAPDWHESMANDLEPDASLVSSLRLPDRFRLPRW